MGLACLRFSLSARKTRPKNHLCQRRRWGGSLFLTTFLTAHCYERVMLSLPASVRVLLYCWASLRDATCVSTRPPWYFIQHREWQRHSEYLNEERVPLVLTLYGLDCHILPFPYGLEDNSKCTSANSLKKDKATSESSGFSYYSCSNIISFVCMYCWTFFYALSSHLVSSTVHFFKLINITVH